MLPLGGPRLRHAPRLHHTPSCASRPAVSLPWCLCCVACLPSPSLPPCRAVEAEVKLLCEGALAVARDVVSANLRRHTDLSAHLRQEERVEGAALQVGGWAGWGAGWEGTPICCLRSAVLGGCMEPRWRSPGPACPCPPPQRRRPPTLAAAAGVARGHRGAPIAQGLCTARGDARRHCRCRQACAVIILLEGAAILALEHLLCSCTFHCTPCTLYPC